jgi:hypothetical protein
MGFNSAFEVLISNPPIDFSIDANNMHFLLMGAEISPNSFRETCRN